MFGRYLKFALTGCVLALACFANAPAFAATDFLDNAGMEVDADVAAGSATAENDDVRQLSLGEFVRNHFQAKAPEVSDS